MARRTGRFCAGAAIAAALMAAAPVQAHGPNHPDAIAAATSGLGATSLSGVFAQPLSAAAVGPASTTIATILSISDFHGRLNPTTFRIDANGEQFGGAARLQTLFEQRAALSPTPPFLVTQGDAVGATQPVSGLLGDRPTIEVMNAMGFDADTLGNHNFDDGVERMEELARLADFPYLVTNVVLPDGKAPAWTKPAAVWEVGDTRIGVIGAMNADAPDLLKPGLLGDLRITDPAESLNRAAAELRSQGVKTVVALAHVGADPTSGGPDGAKGPLIDLAKKLQGVDLLLGDHTYWQVNQPVRAADGQLVWVVQSVPNGITFSEIKLTINDLDGEALGVVAAQFPTSTRTATEDPEIKALVDGFNTAVAPLVEEQVGSSTKSIPENPTASTESNQGNLVTDALRERTGAQLGLLNSGGLRAPLTNENRRENAGGNYVIRRGDVLAMLPFNNQITQVTVTGTELKRMLENGVSQLPKPDARFPQISGFTFSFQPTAVSGSRVTGAALADAARTPIRFTDDARYTLVTNDFVATGGDGYPNFTGRLTYLGDVEDELIAYLQARPGLVPVGPPHDAPQRITIG